MVEGSITALATKRGSIWGRDGIYYPSTEEPEVPLSGAAIQLILYLYAALRQVLYPLHEQIYVAADQFIYYVPQQRNRKVAPDVWVCFGVPKQPERACFRTWEEGATPSFVCEVSSVDSRLEDRGPKMELYRDTLGCREYLVYDEDLDELSLLRWVEGSYHPVEPGPDGLLYSRELGVRFSLDPKTLVRVYDTEGAPVPTFVESEEERQLLRGIRQRLEAEAGRRAEEARLLQEESDRRAKEAARLAEEATALSAQLDAERHRSAALETEVESLRAELQRRDQVRPEQ